MIQPHCFSVDSVFVVGGEGCRAARSIWSSWASRFESEYWYNIIL